MNSRKYPRTLDEAFPFGPAYGCAIESPSRTDKVAGIVLAIFIGTFLAYGLMVYLT